MKFLFGGVILLAVAALVLSGCAADPTPTPSFYTHLSMSAGGETIVVGEIRNAGFAAMRSMIGWQGVLQVQDQAGETVACATASEFTASIRPGDSDFPMRWVGPLAPGDYELVWGAPGRGGIRVGFRVLERDGALIVARGETARVDGGAVPAAQGCAGDGGESAQGASSQEAP